MKVTDAKPNQPAPAADLDAMGVAGSHSSSVRQDRKRPGVSIRSVLELATGMKQEHSSR
jgi:hypothetical protein